MPIRKLLPGAGIVVVVLAALWALLPDDSRQEAAAKGKAVVASEFESVPKRAGRLTNTTAHAPDQIQGSVPALRSTAKPLVETDSLRPGYDFEKMYALLDGNIRQIYDSEKRDPAWAPEMEGRIRNDLERDFKIIGTNAKVTALDCRSTTCRFTLSADDKKSLLIADDFAQNFARGDYIAHDFSDGTGELELVLIYGFSQERRPLDVHDQEYQLMRQWRLSRWRAAKAEGRVFDYEIPEK